MGSGFVAYATIMTIILLVGEQWVRRSGRSPEWWDSWCVVLSAWLLRPLISSSTRVITLWVYHLTHTNFAPLMSLPFINRELVRKVFQYLNLLLILIATVNTFTEHHGGGWSFKDMQHTFVFQYLLALIYQCSKLTMVTGS